MVHNFICRTCKKIAVCRVFDNIVKFSNTQKKQLGVDVTIDECENYDEDEDSPVTPDCEEE